MAKQYDLGLVRGVAIDDAAPSSTKAYSSQKTQYELDQLSQQKANQAGWTAGKNVVTDANGNITTEDKPTTPSALPNPKALTINGQSYDGSQPVEVNTSDLPDGGTAGQVLAKKSDKDHDVQWSDLAGAGMTLEVIYENPRPYDSFAAQDVPITVPDGVNLVLIEFAESGRFHYSFFRIAEGGAMCSASIMYKWETFTVFECRVVNMYRNRMHVEDGYLSMNISTGLTLDNMRLVPSRVFAVGGINI